ncbi:MAG: beta-lactamase family protein [Variibacter sp.]|nr:beta-lactamase family protein [Variibacter sp.]
MAPLPGRCIGIKHAARPPEDASARAHGWSAGGVRDRHLPAFHRRCLLPAASTRSPLEPVGRPIPASALPGIDAAIESAIAEARIVGAVVMVAQDGAVIFHRAAGLADRERHVPMREDAVFRLASVTKPMVTAAALRLVELGRIALADPVTRYLPGFRPALLDGSTPAITLRHLLTHTAGLSYGFLEPPDGPYHRAGVSDGLDQPGLPMDEAMRRIARAGLAYMPGTRWAYSVAIDVLGAALEAVEGMRLDGVVADHVTKPLGLSDTGFDLDASQRARLATPYADAVPAPTRVPDAGQHIHFPPGLALYAGAAGVHAVPNRVFDPASFRSGGGGMVGTAGNILRFVEAIRTGGEPILWPETAAAMMSVQTGDFPITNRGPGWAFGYGGAILTDPVAANSPQSPGTFGWGGVWGHQWFIDPARRLSVVALTNTTFEGMMGRFTRELRDAVYRDTR